MTKNKPKVPEKADDKEQSERFIKTARDREADEGSKHFERVFGKIVPPKVGKPTSEIHRVKRRRGKT